jgi:hypothetical protein
MSEIYLKLGDAFQQNKLLIITTKAVVVIPNLWAKLQVW